jgi:FkbM family methyltransferase
MKKYKNFYEVTKKIVTKKKPIIFDIGANKGQSIDGFRKLYPECFIHAFEPNKLEFDQLIINYKKNILINNLGVGDKNIHLNFYMLKASAHSSFLKYKKGTPWLRDRAKYFNTASKKFIISKKKVEVVTIDSYCKKNDINFIDILKIDTEGFDAKVLIGAKNMILKNRIKLIEIEISLDSEEKQAVNNSIYDIEKNLIPFGYKICAIQTASFNCKFNLGFGLDAIYAC